MGKGKRDWLRMDYLDACGCWAKRSVPNIRHYIGADQAGLIHRPEIPKLGAPSDPLKCLFWKEKNVYHAFIREIMVTGSALNLPAILLTDHAFFRSVS